MTALVNQLPAVDAANYVSLDGALGTAGTLLQTITIDSEKMRVIRGGGTSGLLVERGVDSTTIAAHTVGTTVTLSDDGVGSTAAELDVLDTSALAGTRTATAAGDGTGAITATGLVTFVTVTSDSANKIITLPAPVVGLVVLLTNGATGYELRTSAPATIAINGGAEADAESAIAASTLVWAVCTSATTWQAWSITGTTLAAVEAAAAA